MEKKLYVRPLRLLARFADTLMVPVMYALSGTFLEAPQRTHFWNNAKLRPADVAHLDQAMMVHAGGIKEASRRISPLFHAPVLGGWRDYVVLTPLRSDERQWHVGWIADDVIGVSQLRITGKVRMLIGRGDVSFFGIDAQAYEQIKVLRVSFGRIGDGGSFRRVPLL